MTAPALVGILVGTHLTALALGLLVARLRLVRTRHDDTDLLALATASGVTRLDWGRDRTPRIGYTYCGGCGMYHDLLEDEDGAPLSDEQQPHRVGRRDRGDAVGSLVGVVGLALLVVLVAGAFRVLVPEGCQGTRAAAACEHLHDRPTARTTDDAP